MLRIGSLFSGIGGLDLGLPGHPTWMCEFDPHARRVLEQRFPGVPVYHDVRELDGSVPPVDVLTGGYPCQPFSVAGKRQGENDPRHLWPEFIRLVRVLRPRLVFAENVSGHLALGFDRVLCDLAEAGFDAEWVVVRASDVGAPHRRERLFVVATDTERERRAERRAEPEGREGRSVSFGDRPSVADAEWVREHADAGVRRGDARGGDPAGRATLLAGAQVARPADALADRSSLAADAGRDGLVRLKAGDGPYGGVGVEPWDDADGRDLAGAGSHDGHDGEAATHAGTGIEWGGYEPAIRRWALVLGRLAPAPTDDRGRLTPAFVEWMMGFPAGWVSDDELGVTRTQALKMLGNAVVPQQAALAWGILTEQQRST